MHKPERAGGQSLGFRFGSRLSTRTSAIDCNDVLVWEMPIDVHVLGSQDRGIMVWGSVCLGETQHARQTIGPVFHEQYEEAEVPFLETPQRTASASQATSRGKRWEDPRQSSHCHCVNQGHAVRESQTIFSTMVTSTRLSSRSSSKSKSKNKQKKKAEQASRTWQAFHKSPSPVQLAP